MFAFAERIIQLSRVLRKLAGQINLFITSHVIPAHRAHEKSYFGSKIRADFSADITIFFLKPAPDSSDTVKTMLRLI